MKLICFDCDSTLSTIEGIDELARFVGSDVYEEVENLTHAAMNGEVPVEQVFERRLEIIAPTADQVAIVGENYCQSIVPQVRETIQALQNEGWTCCIISGGFTQAIRPLAALLGIEEVHAVELYFSSEGAYAGYDNNAWTARSGGKGECMRALLERYNPQQSVMVGDGVSDLETQGLVDRFIGCGSVIVRTQVKEQASFFVTNFADIYDLCQFSSDKGSL